MCIEEITLKSIKTICKDLVELDRHIINILGDIYSAEKWDESNFLKDVPGKWGLSSYMQENKSILGFCICSNDLCGNAHINRIAISSDVRGTGVGSKLLQATERKAAEQGIRKLNLFVNEKNIDAIRFYEKKGFYIVRGVELVHRMKNAGKIVNNELYVLDTDTNTKLLFYEKCIGG